MKNSFNQILKHTSLALLTSLMLSLPAMADNVRLVNKPLVESTTSDVLPNLMYILDNSGSMNQNYTPDWANSATRQLFRNAAYNTQYYNPTIRYLPASDFAGVDMPSYTDPALVRTDGFYQTTNYTMDSHLGNTNTDTITDIRNRAHYFTNVPGEYCTTANLTNCINSSVATTTHTFSAPIRWCNHNTGAGGTANASTLLSPPASACRAVREGNFTNLRTIPTSTFTLTFTGSGITTVSSIKINGIEIMSNSVSANNKTTAAQLAGLVKSEIDACTSSIIGNCTITSHSASLNAAKLTVTSPAGVSIGPIVVVRSGSIAVAATAALPTTAGRLGSLVYTDIVSSNNAYPYPGSLASDPDRDCVSAVCSYAEEITNYANWYAYYRTRMQGMKTSTSLAFKPIDNRYRVGFITINSPSSNYLPIAKYELAATQQKDQWYTHLFSTVPSGTTPLRAALSRVGRIYANKPVGFAAGDPVEYACQDNFSLLTTDGYWNGAAGTDINNNPIGNLDNIEASSPRPKFDGGDSAASGTLADVAKYYYDTDIRNNTGADASLRFNNCTGALGQDVCGEGAGNESIKIQKMTTLTLGLGIDGTLIYSNDYKNQKTGDFADIKSPLGLRDWPVPVADSPSAIDDLWHAAVNGNGTYFSARTPKELSDSLKKALSDIQSKVGAGSAASASSLQPTAGDNFNYVASYATVKWIGNLEARTVNLTTFETSKSAAWCAENVAADAVQGIAPCTGTMASKVGAASDSRNIMFNVGGTISANNFNYGNLNTTQKAFFETTFLSNNLSQWPDLTTVTGGQREKAVGNGIVNFLRGQQGFEDRSSNAGDDRIFRFRETTLGDITESQPAFISKPVFNYTDAGYQAFKTATAQSTRPGRIYVGANDGMLHAFDATNGQEVWAFVPTPVIPKMWKLADRDYATNHVNLVNGDPTIAEVCVATPAVCASSATASDWRTVLVGGLSGGGRGYYALDITNPNTPQLLWEYTAENNANLGYSFGSPIVTKLADGRWVALLTSGYNNGAFDNNGATANSPAGVGKGYLFVVDVNTGAVIKTFPTNEGDSNTPSGLGQVSAFVDDVSKNNLAKFVYGGDLLGNLWRFDLDDLTGTPPLKLATLIGPDGAQPITTAPQLGVINKKRVIFVGTGKYLEVGDLTDPDKQSLYAIKDDSNTPLGDPRTSLIEQMIDKTTRKATNFPVSFDTNLGWFVDFPDDRERMNIEPFLVNGVLLAPTVVPKSTSCSPGGYGWFNFFNYKTGSSVISSGLVSEKLKSPAVGFNLVYDASGKPVVTVVESNNPTPHTIDNKDIATGNGSNRTTILNLNPDGTYGRKSIWRELIR